MSPVEVKSEACQNSLLSSAAPIFALPRAPRTLLLLSGYPELCSMLSRTRCELQPRARGPGIRGLSGNRSGNSNMRMPTMSVLSARPGGS